MKELLEARSLFKHLSLYRFQWREKKNPLPASNCRITFLISVLHGRLKHFTGVCWNSLGYLELLHAP